MAWFAYTALCTLLWGLWGFCSALAERALPPERVFGWHCAGLVATAAVAAPFVRARKKVLRFPGSSALN